MFALHSILNIKNYLFLFSFFILIFSIERLKKKSKIKNFKKTNFSLFNIIVDLNEIKKKLNESINLNMRIKSQLKINKLFNNYQQNFKQLV